MKLIQVDIWHYDVVDDDGNLIKSFKQEYENYIDDKGWECSKGLSANQILKKAEEFMSSQS